MSTIDRSTPRLGTGRTALSRATFEVDSRERLVG
jgi:hypothetical protein